MTVQDYVELAGKLLEYSMEIKKREIRADKKSDFETLKKIYKIQDHIEELLKVIDKEY